MFLQIHTLTSYPASLLNRDDAGLAKRIPFGDAIRLRISSQCLKRHWREDLQERLPELPDGLRTRSFFPRAVLPGVMAGGVPEDRARMLVAELAKALVKGGVKDDGALDQPILFGLRERDYFIHMLVDMGKDAADDEAVLKALNARLKSTEEKKNLEAMKRAASGLTGTLFGRMVTSDLLARVDAPVHVAHAFTVHAADTEMDYFTVVDDLNREDETGAAHANQSELGAGIYYSHIVVDIPLLVSNLSGTEAPQWRAQEPATARSVLSALIQAATSRTPGAKLGSTAPYARAECLLLEAGTQQPRTLANAYLEAIRPQRGQPMLQAIERLGDYLQRIDGMYGRTADWRALSTIHDARGLAPLAAQPLDAAIQSTLDAIWS